MDTCRVCNGMTEYGSVHPECIEEVGEPCPHENFRDDGEPCDICDAQDEAQVVASALMGGGIEMVPVKGEWFVEIEKRLAALEALCRELTRDVNGKLLVTDYLEMAGVNDRLAAVEELLKPVAPEVVLGPGEALAEKLFGGQPTPGPVLERWLKGKPEAVRFPTEGVEQVPKGWSGEKEIWRTGTIAVEHRELEGLDLMGFKTLLREKFRELGDELVTAFLKEREVHDERDPD